MTKIKVTTLIGSLRKNSFNRMVFETAKTLCPADMELVEIKFDHLPMFNQDIEDDLPESVKIFKKQIKESDAILFITPEYNYSIPGVLKNAIDWGSRPYADNSWSGKPAAIMSASISSLGGIRGQGQLREMFVDLNVFALNKPEVMVVRIQDKIENNKITDEITLGKIKEQLEAFLKWINKING